MTAEKRAIFGVVGSGCRAYPELSQGVGRLAAQLGCHLLTGGGEGVMAEASRAFCAVSPRAGSCLGILRGKVDEASGSVQPPLSFQPSPPNPWVEIPIFTHLPHSGSRGREASSRNHLIVLSADVLVALPGSEGTGSEVTLRLDYGKRVILFLGNHRLDGRGAGHFLALARFSGQVVSAASLEELARIVGQQLEGVALSRPAAGELVVESVPATNPGKIEW